jgi:hypothetical protein
MSVNVVNFLKTLHKEDAAGRIVNVNTISIPSVNIVHFGHNFITLYMDNVVPYLLMLYLTNHNSEVFIFHLCLHF